MPQLQTLRMVHGASPFSSACASEGAGSYLNDKSDQHDRRNNSEEFDDLDEDSCPVLETDPTGRYLRYNQLLGRGATKTVYRAFDQEQGVEVAWNQIDIDSVCMDPAVRNQIYAEINLLKHLKHKSVMTFHFGWFDKENHTINFITELFSDGTLRQYRKKLRAPLKETCLKRWAWQILEGLVYLHGHNPPIIHRDLKCDNIFVNGTAGRVKIGDLGLATCNRGLSVVGTPEFMAPEIYTEKYDEKVDIWAFGMCMLELAVLEFPYSECRNIAQIWKRVTTGVLPEGLAKIQNTALRAFIECCVQFNPKDRPSARELLRHPFLQDLRAEANAGYNLSVPVPVVANSGPRPAPAACAVPILAAAASSQGATVEMETEHTCCMQTTSSVSRTCSGSDQVGGNQASNDFPMGSCDVLNALDPANHHATAANQSQAHQSDVDDSDEEVLMPLASLCPSMLEANPLNAPLTHRDPLGLPRQQEPAPASAGDAEAPSSPSSQPGSLCLVGLLEAIDTPGPKVLVRRRMLVESFGKIGPQLQSVGNEMLRRSGANARAAFLRRTYTSRCDSLLPHHSRHRSATSLAVPSPPDAGLLFEDHPHVDFALVGSAPQSHPGAHFLHPAHAISAPPTPPGSNFCSPLRTQVSDSLREYYEQAHWTPELEADGLLAQAQHPLLTPASAPLLLPASPRALLRHTLS